MSLSEALSINNKIHSLKQIRKLYSKQLSLNNNTQQYRQKQMCLNKSKNLILMNISDHFSSHGHISSKHEMVHAWYISTMSQSQYLNIYTSFYQIGLHNDCITAYDITFKSILEKQPKPGIILPNQWSIALQCNTISHWLGANTEWSLKHVLITMQYIKHQSP